MKAIRPVGSVLCAALLASACADSMMAPTGTDRRASPPAGGPSGYMLPPVIVVACSGSYVKDDLGDHCVPVAEEQTRDGAGGGTTGPGYGGGAGADGGTTTKPAQPDSASIINSDIAAICDPKADPNCTTALKPEEKRTLQRLMNRWYKNGEVKCEEAKVKFNSMLGEGKIMKGTNAETDNHDGATWQGVSHIDTDVLVRYRDAASAYPQTPYQQAQADAYGKQATALALHEVLHVLYPKTNHSAQESAAGVYTTYPYSLLEPSVGGPKCVAF